MAQTKEEILAALDNISGPVPASVLKDIVNSILELVEANTIGTQLETLIEASIDPSYVAVDGDTMIDDLEFTINTVGIILLDRGNANRYRLYMNNGTLAQETVA